MVLADLGDELTLLEWAAALVTLANVWLATRENMWTWPTGIASVTLYAIVFYQSRLFGNAALQGVYFIMTLHGWYEWLRGGVNHTPLRVRRATAWQWTVSMTAGVALTLPILWLLRRYSGSVPMADALTTAFSLVAQWMLNEKLLENWWIWLAVDVVAVPMYIKAGNSVTAGLYAILAALCVKGLIDWRRSLASA